jgi:uncharacterized protein (DUF1330 family)
VEITDPQKFAEYVQRLTPMLGKYGAKYLVGGREGYETIEGNWQSQAVVLLEFKDKEHFERWYNSPAPHAGLFRSGDSYTGSVGR